MKAYKNAEENFTHSLTIRSRANVTISFTPHSFYQLSTGYTVLTKINILVPFLGIPVHGLHFADNYQVLSLHQQCPIMVS
jgi:hypothetical protein